MQERLSRWGIGPRIAAAALTYAAIAGVATRGWPDVCRMRFLPDPVFVAAGSLLTLLGVVMLAVAARALTKAYNQSQLVASGIFALVRHPIYSAWIVLIVPGLGLISRSWPVLLTALVAYAVFKRLIHREDDDLKRQFGEAYLNYRFRVNELLPIPKL